MHERVPLLSKSIYVTTLLVHIALLCAAIHNPAYKRMQEKISYWETAELFFCEISNACVCVFELVLFLELRDTLKNVLKLKMLCFKRDFFCLHMRQRIYFIAKWNEPSKHCYCLSLAQWMCIATLNKKKEE